MELREQTIKEMVRLLSEEQVITDENVIIENEGATVHNYEKAFGHKNPHQPLCVVNVKNKEEIKKVLTYCNENKIHVIARTGASSSEDQLLVIDDQTIIVDASAMNRLIKLDTENMMATVECGCRRPVGKTGQRKGTDHRTQPAVLPRWHTWATLWPREVSASSPPTMAESRICSAAWRQSCQTERLLELKMRREDRQVLICAISF